MPMSNSKQRAEEHYEAALGHFVGRIQEWFPAATPVNPKAEEVVEELRVTPAATARATELRVNRDTLTVEGVARKLGLTAQTVRSYLAEERLPGRKIGKRWQVNEVELDAWIADGRMDAVPAHERVEATRRSIARAQDLRDGYGPSF